MKKNKFSSASAGRKERKAMNQQYVFRSTKEQSEKIESVRRTYGFKTTSDAVKKIIDEYSPICEKCYGQEDVKRIRKNGETVFLCEACSNANYSH